VDHKENLIEQLKAGRVVVIVGAGVSKAISDRAAAADWVGLVTLGIEHVSKVVQVSKNWGDIQGLALDDALDTGEADDLISVASAVASKLKGSSQQAFSNWIADTVGVLPIVDKRLPLALAGLRAPLLTTNYDKLLEKVLGRSTAVWTDPEAMRRCFVQNTDTIGHLHGVWDQPESIIFSQSDYDRLTSDKSAQFVQQAQYSTKSFLYVGYGSGLDDPNFSKLLDEHASLFPASQAFHFRLCRDEELDDLQTRHLDSDIRVLSYGETFSDLAPYLTGLADELFLNESISGNVIDSLAFAREEIVEKIKTDGAVGVGADDNQFRDLDDLTVAPVLLPMSHEQFASMQTVDKGSRPERLDPHKVIEGKKVLVVVGEEHSGLTTALRWLVAKAALATNGVAPIYVDARLGVSSTHPVEHLLRKEAQHLRLIDRQYDPIPSHALAVDNVVYREDTTYDRLIEDLLETPSEFLVVGCRLGDEQYIIRSLEGHRFPVEVAHIGKMSRPEIDGLTALIAPDSPRSMCDSVLEISRREHLPRNPFTISLLISLVSQLGRRNEAYNSETSVLDEYVKLLLGKNGAHIDARVTLTAQNREKIISDIAKIFVRRRKGSLPSSDVIRHMEKSFEELAWKEDAISWLTSFRNAKVLRQVEGEVQFQQSSYLHLFAAKAAIDDDEFRNEMFADPLYFAPIIRHFAALLRNSKYAVMRMNGLLNDWQSHVSKGRAFGRIERRAAPAPKEIEEADSQELGQEPADNQVEPEAHRTDGEASLGTESPGNEYDVSDDTDMVPFPLTDQTNLSPATRLVNAVDLVSRVVRDSDELQDRVLKVEVLGKALTAWGVLIDEFETEEVFKPAVDMLVEHLTEDHNFDDERIEQLTGRMSLYLPSFYALGGMQATLASRKLLITFDSLMKDDNYRAKEFGPVAAAMFAFLLADKGWSAYLPPLAESHGDRWVVTGMLASLARVAYVNQALALEDEERILDFLRTCETRRWSFESKAQEDRHLAQFDQRLTKKRKLNRSKMLESGKTAAGDLLGY
jgi:hypothetical protein